MSVRVAEACTTKGCAHLRCNGDRISFCSSDQIKAHGMWPLERGLFVDTDRRGARHYMFRFPDGRVVPLAFVPSDVTYVPTDFVVVQDASGAILSPCALFIARARRGGSIRDAHPDDIEMARAYFGERAKLPSGYVEVPKGPWQRLCSVKVIRYTRYGENLGAYEHPYQTPVGLFGQRQPMAFKLALPRACIVDERGFVRP